MSLTVYITLGSVPFICLKWPVKQSIFELIIQGNVRLASATTISQLLMMGDFQLRINDTKHEIQLPDDQIARLLLVNEDNEVYTEGVC